MARQFHQDALGSVETVSRAAGSGTGAAGSVEGDYRLDAFGNALPGTATDYTVRDNPFTYLGGLGYWNEPDLGLSYVRARWLDTATGSWLSVDPVEGEPRYSYADNAPTYRTDASGRQSDPPLTPSFAIPSPPLQIDVFASNPYVKRRLRGLSFSSSASDRTIAALYGRITNGINLSQIFSSPCKSEAEIEAERITQRFENFKARLKKISVNKAFHNLKPTKFTTDALGEYFSGFFHGVLLGILTLNPLAGLVAAIGQIIPLLFSPNFANLLEESLIEIVRGPLRIFSEDDLGLTDFERGLAVANFIVTIVMFIVLALTGAWYLITRLGGAWTALSRVIQANLRTAIVSDLDHMVFAAAGGGSHSSEKPLISSVNAMSAGKGNTGGGKGNAKGGAKQSSGANDLTDAASKVKQALGNDEQAAKKLQDSIDTSEKLAQNAKLLLPPSREGLIRLMQDALQQFQKDIRNNTIPIPQLRSTHIPATQRTLGIAGSVKRPGIYGYGISGQPAPVGGYNPKIRISETPNYYYPNRDIDNCAAPHAVQDLLNKCPELTLRDIIIIEIDPNGVEMASCENCYQLLFGSHNPAGYRLDRFTPGTVTGPPFIRRKGQSRIQPFVGPMQQLPEK